MASRRRRNTHNAQSAVRESEEDEMVFITGAEPDVIKNAIHVPETYPADDDGPPFDPRDVVRIRADATFDDFYEICGDPLGEGKFGKVYLCREKATGLELAAKFIRIRKDADRATVEREVSIMTQMRHVRIAQIYDAFHSGTSDIILLMEIVRGGELFNRVAEDGYILTERAVAMIVCQICEAIEYIHSQNIIHLDIKPENIMCVSEKGNRIKLIDFGLAQHYDGSKDLYYMAGTPEFAAPEVIKYEPLDFRTDMWSVGVITYILLSGYSPFLGDNVAETYVNVERGEWEFTEEFDEISENAKEFIKNLLSYDKHDRMYPRECLKHPWIVEARQYVPSEVALEQEKIDNGPELDTKKQLRRYLVRRRFRKIAFAVMCYVDFLKILSQLRVKQSVKGEEYFGAARVRFSPEKDEIIDMGAISSKKALEERTKAAEIDKNASNSSDDATVERTAPKKKKKQTATTSSERPDGKKAKKEDDAQVANGSSTDTPALDESKEKSQKKRMKKDVTAMQTSSQEKPPKMAKSSDSKERLERKKTKSASPFDVPSIREDSIQEGEKKPKKKLVKPASSDSGVVIDNSAKRTNSGRSRDDESVSELLSPEDALVRRGEKTLKKSQSTENGKESKDTPTKKSTVSSKKSMFENSDAPLPMPVICVQPPTPSTSSSQQSQKARPTRTQSPLTIQIPSPTTSSLTSSQSTAATSGIHSPGEMSPDALPQRKKSEADAQKKKVWRQEKYADGDRAESRQSTEVISVPKNQAPPSVEAEKAALVKRRALASPLAERIARMENMAKQKENESLQRRSKIKIERESSSGIERKSPAPQTKPPAKIIPVIAEKSSTTTKTTTTSVKQSKEEKDSVLVINTDKKKIEQREKKEKETEVVKISQTEKREEQTSSEKMEKTSKTTVRKTSTTAASKKTRDEASELENSSVTTAKRDEKHEVLMKAKASMNGTVHKDDELTVTVEKKKKAIVKSSSVDKKPSSALLSEVESVSVAAKTKDKKEKVKKSATTACRLNEDGSLSSADATPTKKSGKKSEEPSQQFVDYPASLARDIELFKEAQAKARRKEEELQRRHVHFADESHASPCHAEASSSTHKMGRSSSEESKKDDKDQKKRKNSYFEVTEDEEDTLATKQEDFSFSALKNRLEKKLMNKRGESEEEEQSEGDGSKKDVIHCPSTNSLLKKWKTYEKANG